MKFKNWNIYMVLFQLMIGLDPWNILSWKKKIFKHIKCIFKLKKVENTLCIRKYQTERSQNFCVLNLGIQHLSPSYGDLHINLIPLWHPVVVKPCRDILIEGSSIDSKIKSAYIGYRDRVFEINDTHHKRSDLWF